MNVCGAKKRAGGECKNRAGKGTEHLGEGRCRLHGGAGSGRPIIHGRYSLKHRENLQAKVQKFLEDSKPGSLFDELALERALLQDLLDKVTGQIDQKTRGAIVFLISEIRKTVESISRMMNQTALTQADIKFLQAVLSDLLIRYIDDPEKRLAFLGELRDAMGTDPSTRRELGYPE
ncbi:MAG: hypothetical protein IIC78_15165 [Chloroflexi bacterium]|nr:hypothetical protein [Chloroflexota bacterium]